MQDTLLYQTNVGLVSPDSRLVKEHIHENPAEEPLNIQLLTKARWMRRPEKSPMNLKTAKGTCLDPLVIWLSGELGALIWSKEKEQHIVMQRYAKRPPLFGPDLILP